jgi:hypothetical protein
VNIAADVYDDLKPLLDLDVTLEEAWPAKA